MTSPGVSHISDAPRGDVTRAAIREVPISQVVVATFFAVIFGWYPLAWAGSIVNAKVCHVSYSINAPNTEATRAKFDNNVHC